ncbi:hypothetical protein ACVILH_001662 [Bradyrhizobium sp. USDA 4353]
MDDEVEPAPGLAQCREDAIDAGDVLDIARQHVLDAELVGKRTHALAERIALVGEGHLGAVRSERLGDAPGDRMVVGDAHHQTAFACHQTLHDVSPSSCRARALAA